MSIVSNITIIVGFVYFILVHGYIIESIVWHILKHCISSNSNVKQQEYSIPKGY